MSYKHREEEPETETTITDWVNCTASYCVCSLVPGQRSYMELLRWEGASGNEATVFVQKWT